MFLRIVLWSGLFALLIMPLVAAGFSPYLAWRSPIYIVAGFAGITALSCMVLQPIAARKALPGLSILFQRKLHRWFGIAIVTLVIVHVGGLWITSPPDVVDVLLLRSPTPFSVWGLLAMWVVFATAVLALARLRGWLRWKTWAAVHPPLVLLAVIGTVIHTLLIVGTMESVTKWVICIAALVGGLWAVFAKRIPQGD